MVQTHALFNALCYINDRKKETCFLEGVEYLPWHGDLSTLILNSFTCLLRKNIRHLIRAQTESKNWQLKFLMDISFWQFLN